MKMTLNKTVFIICICLLIFGVAFLFWPRKEYRIPDSIHEKVVLRVSESFQSNKSKNYILDLDTKKYSIYTGSYNDTVLIQNKPTGGTIIYNSDKNYYIKDMQIYSLYDLIKTYPVLTVAKQFKYWTKDNNYLIAIDNTKKNVGLLWFDLGWPSVQIINLKTGNVEQIYFYDSINPNLRIATIIGIVE